MKIKRTLCSDITFSCFVVTLWKCAVQAIPGRRRTLSAFEITDDRFYISDIILESKIDTTEIKCTSEMICFANNSGLTESYICEGQRYLVSKVCVAKH